MQGDESPPWGQFAMYTQAHSSHRGFLKCPWAKHTSFLDRWPCTLNSLRCFFLDWSIVWFTPHMCTVLRNFYNEENRVSQIYCLNTGLLQVQKKTRCGLYGTTLTKQSYAYQYFFTFIVILFYCSGALSRKEALINNCFLPSVTKTAQKLSHHLIKWYITTDITSGHFPCRANHDHTLFTKLSQLFKSQILPSGTGGAKRRVNIDVRLFSWPET